MKRELRGKKFRSAQRLQHIFEKWAERRKKNASLAKGDTSKKRPSSHLHKVPTRNNKVNPRTLQTALVYVLRNTLVKFRANLHNSEVQDTGREAEKLNKASCLKPRKTESYWSSINSSYNFLEYH
jgi:hypothetical protein